MFKRASSFLFSKFKPLALVGVLFQASVGMTATQLECLNEKDLSEVKGINLAELKFETLDAQDLQVDLDQEGDFWTLYRASFSPDELVDPHRVVQHMASRRIMILRAKVDNRTAGFSYVVPMEKVPVSLLGYLAVDPKWQRSGLGRAILKCTLHEDNKMRTKRSQESSMGLIAEIARPDLAEGEEAKTRENVLKFYDRMGHTILLEDYFMPPLSDDSSAIDYYLSFVPLTPGMTYSKDFPSQVRRAVYSEVYSDYWKKEGEARFGQ